MPSHLRIDLWFFDLFDRIGNKERILNYGTWLTAKRVLNPSALTLARSWVILFPLITFLASLLPLEMHIDRISITIGESYVPPFNIALSIISAIFLILADAVYKIFCPDVVQRYEPVFNRFPTSYPPDMADEVYRAYLFAGEPKTLKVRFLNLDVMRGFDHRYRHGGLLYGASVLFHRPTSEYTAEDDTLLVSSTELRAKLDRQMKFHNSTLSPVFGLGISYGNLLRQLLSIPIFGEKGHDRASFRNIYEFSTKIRILPRLIFWLFYLLGAVPGVCLTVQIMWRALMFAIRI